MLCHRRDHQAEAVVFGAADKKAKRINDPATKANTYRALARVRIRQKAAPNVEMWMESLDSPLLRVSAFIYAPQEHGLERRAHFPQPFWQTLTERIGPSAFFVGLTSIIWRESWKYGERAYRYCRHDVGHALGALRFAAAMLGWRMHTYRGSPTAISRSCWAYTDPMPWPRTNGRLPN